MLNRIVKMSFKPEKIPEFLENFEQNKHKISGFDGCHKVELLRDKHNTNRFFTYSYWTDETALENYRNSEIFNGIWAKTKVLFNEKPEAWSTEVVSGSEV